MRGREIEKPEYGFSNLPNGIHASMVSRRAA
jgi:hypothetical protein